MLFNSIEFLIFLPVVYLLYRVLGTNGEAGLRWQNRMLLVASYLFYGWWDVRFLFLIVLSTAIDYCCGLMISRGHLTRGQWASAVGWAVGGAVLFVVPDWSAITSEGIDWGRVFADPLGWQVTAGLVIAAVVAQLSYRSVWLKMAPDARGRFFVGLSVVANLGILAFFKYFNFFIDNAEALASSVGLSADALRLDIVLPVGISFYTFQTMSYTLDIHRKKFEATDRFLEFALFVSYFPQLVAGPIERASHLLPRVLGRRQITYDQSMRGLNLILFGFFKKVAIADSVAGSVDSIFLTTGAVTWMDVIGGTLLFTAQIYCDFSGYSDIARGVSKLLGIDLMTNFNQPYFSLNPSEFWRRWHISLSSWLRDYLYIALGGNRHGIVMTYRNLALTMLLGGLWHGAAWNFVLWGAYQGTILCVHRYFTHGKPNKPAHGPLKFVAMAFFFMVTCYGWLLFRAVSLEQVADFTGLLFTDFGNLATSVKRPTLAGLIGLPLLIALEMLQYRSGGNPQFYREYPTVVRGFIYAVMLFAILLGMSNAQAQFIYFQF